MWHSKQKQVKDKKQAAERDYAGKSFCGKMMDYLKHILTCANLLKFTLVLSAGIFAIITVLLASEVKRHMCQVSSMERKYESFQKTLGGLPANYYKNDLITKICDRTLENDQDLPEILAKAKHASKLLSDTVTLLVENKDHLA